MDCEKCGRKNVILAQTTNGEPIYAFCKDCEHVTIHNIGLYTELMEKSKK